MLYALLIEKDQIIYECFNHIERVKLRLNYIRKRIKSRVSSFLTEKRNQP